MDYLQSEYLINGGDDPLDLIKNINVPKKHDIKENNVKRSSIVPYESSIKGGDYYDDPNANQNEIINTSRTEQEIAAGGKAKALSPLKIALENKSDCADISKKQGELCMPEEKIKEVLIINNAKSLEDAKTKTACDSEKCVALRTSPEFSIYFKQINSSTIIDFQTPLPLLKAKNN